MIPSVAFHGARIPESAQEAQAPKPPEIAPVESPRSPPVAEPARSADAGPSQAGPESRENGASASDQAQAQAQPKRSAADARDTTRESTRPVAGEPLKTVHKMREALADALGPPFSQEEANLAAQANRNLMDAQSELRKIRAAEVYSGVGPETSKTEAWTRTPGAEETQAAASEDKPPEADEHVDRRV